MTQEAMTEIQRENVDLARRVSEIGGSSDMRALVERFDEFCWPDFVWKPRMIGFGRDAYIGRDGFRQYVDDMEATADEIELKVAELRVIGDDHVLLVGRLCLTGRGSGVPLDMKWAILYAFEGGRLRSGTAFNSHAEGEAEASRIAGEDVDAQA